MNTLIPNLSKPYLLDEFLNASDFVVRLFTNNIVGDETNLVFTQPTFNGYNFFNLNKNDWGVSTLNINYATCEYKTPVIFNNMGTVESENIYGYYVTNSANEILWYEKFSVPKKIDVEEGIAIILRVNLNKIGGGLSFVSILLNSENPNFPINSSSIYVLTETWNSKPVPGSLIDVTNRNFNSNNSIFTLLLKSNIVPSMQFPYNFTVVVSSNGFNNLIYSGSIINKGITSFGLTLKPLDGPPPPPPTDPPYNNGDTITLYGPFDTKAGLTLSSLIPDSNFIFKYLNNGNLSLPCNMAIYINDLQVASLDYFTSYNGQPFTFNYESYSFNGVFATPLVNFNVPPPGPTAPPQE